MSETEDLVITIFPDDGSGYRLPLASGVRNIDVDLIATCCANPDCTCREIHILMRPSPGTSWMEPVSEVSARIDADSGEIVSITHGCTQQLNDSLAEAAKNRPLLDILRERWRRIKLLGDADAWRKQDWSWWEPGVLIRWRDAFPGEFDDIVTVDGSLFLVDDQYCSNPQCSCNDVVLAFPAISKGAGAPPEPDTILVDIKKWRAVDREHGSPMSSTQRAFWHACAELPELKQTLRDRNTRIRTIGRELYRMARDRQQESKARTATKVGRNAPCPCGSGKKFKRCCGGP